MSRIAYVNGRYLRHGAASVHIEDRGYQFADGVYEVIAVRGGRLVDGDGHMARLQRSLAALAIAMPMTPAAFQVVLRETVRKNQVRDGIVYLQVTRGVARRDHGFPNGATPALVVTARSTRPQPAHVRDDGIRVITIPDIRWERCDVKAIALLPNVLAKQAAREGGAFEAWQVDAEGCVTEGASTNAWIIDRDGTLITRPPSAAILNGVTRLRLIELARANGMTVEERPFTVAEARDAREAFLTSTTVFVTPVVEIDDAVIGNGKPGSGTVALMQLYEAHMNNGAET